MSTKNKSPRPRLNPIRHKCIDCGSDTAHLSYFGKLCRVCFRNRLTKYITAIGSTVATLWILISYMSG